MRRARLPAPRRGLLPAALGLLCLAVAFVQRPGLTVTDTRIDLSVDPSLFLSRATQVFSGTGDLGHVQSGQFVGYLFPMGPWYALMHALGVPTWIAQRLWLALVLFAAAYGMVRLLDALLGRRRTIAHAVAAVIYSLNPFVVVFVSRATVTLLGLAVLPWLMLAVHRGIRDPRSWRWPAAIGLLGALSGGGVNAAALAWIALAPVALLVYEATAGGEGWVAARKFGSRALLCGAAGSAWWILPVMLQGAYGADFLNFTEQPQTIWATTSMSESLRLLGYWPMYLGTGYGTTQAVMAIGRTYLFDPFVIAASLAVPAGALLGLRSTRRWRYAPFFGLLAVASLAVMCAGFPHGTAFGDLLASLYNHVQSLRFLRTSYKAAPVLALALAALGGVGAEALLAHVRSRDRVLTLPSICFALLGASLVIWALPLFDGRAIDRRLAYDHVPSAWPRALADAGRAAGPNQRTLILPGELFGDYQWGRTWDSVAPATGHDPVAIRQAIQYADPRSAELLADVDDAVQQARLVPGELQPLLQLLGVGQVLVPTDALDSQSGGRDPAGVAVSLAGQSGFTQPRASYGPRQAFAPVLGRDGPTTRLPELRRYVVGGAEGLVHLDAEAPATILDGGPSGVVELAATGRLRAGAPILYAADLGAKRLAKLAAAGARLVFSDSNRRRLVAATYLRQDVGPTLTMTAPIPANGARWNPFPTATAASETVAAYSGLADLTAPQPAGAQLFPAFAPGAALDGSLSTSWLPDPSLPASARWMQLELATPRAIGTITLVPKPVDGVSPLWLAISVNGGAEREVLLTAGSNEVAINVARVHTIRFRVSRATTAQLFLGAGGLEEIEIPGLTPITEALALPTGLTQRLARLDTSHDELSIVLARQTADFPTRAGNDQGVPLARSEVAATDPESGINRIVDLPAARRFTVRGWATVSPSAPDDALDALTGSLRGWSVTSSSRFEGVPGSRASSATDGDRSTAWVGNVVPALSVPFGQDTSSLPLAAAGELLGLEGERTPQWRGALQAPAPWLSIRGPRAVSLSQLRLLPGPGRYASAAVVRIVTDTATSPLLKVSHDGLVKLGRAVRTRSLRIEILAVHPPTGQARGRLLRAVAISEVSSPLEPPAPRRDGPLRSACGALTIRGEHAAAALRITGTVQALDAGTALRISSCGPTSLLSLSAGRDLLSAGSGLVFRPDNLLLDSPARAPLPAPTAGTATLAGGVTPSGVPNGAAVHTHAPAWLVLGESYSPGWRAYCSGSAGAPRSLGAPLPIDGYANGWQVTSRCVHAKFVFGPQRVATAGYLASLIAAPLLLALIALPRRREREAVPQRVPEGPRVDPLVRLSWLGALAAGTVSTVVIGFLFALPIGPLAVPIMWRGTSPRRLYTLGGALLLAVPVAYLIRSAPNAGGFDFGYAYDNLLGHWLAVAGICAIAGGCLLQLLVPAGLLPPEITPPVAPARSGRPTREPLAAQGANP